MDINQIIEQAQMKAEQTGNHIEWALKQVTAGLTIDQIGEIVASEQNDERLVRPYTRLATDRDGQIEAGLRQRITEIARVRMLFGLKL